ncbi:hypothetical protein AGLY_009726 [Aphis glycines]|uniref:Uncharacterized protein n=1 Tax=Aphis glycines TaxID=307491 RepID=A0A6G0THY5_APHGL|nr:hypothetical protein AGLY_009726 [Aphis glycines]
MSLKNHLNKVKFDRRLNGNDSIHTYHRLYFLLVKLMKNKLKRFPVDKHRTRRINYTNIRHTYYNKYSFPISPNSTLSIYDIGCVIDFQYMRNIPNMEHTRNSFAFVMLWYTVLPWYCSQSPRSYTAARCDSIEYIGTCRSRIYSYVVVCAVSFAHSIIRLWPLKSRGITSAAAVVWNGPVGFLRYLRLDGDVFDAAGSVAGRSEPVDDLVQRHAGGLGQDERAEQRGDEARDGATRPHGPDAESGHQHRVHLDGGEHELVTARVQDAVHGALDGHREHLAAHAPRQRQHGEHGEEHVRQERHDQQVGGRRVGRVAVRVQVTDHGGHGRAHAQPRDGGQLALGRGLEHEADDGAGQPGGAQVHGRGHAVDGHAAVAHHVHRVEQQHVEPGRLLAAEERQGGERGLPDGGPRVRGPAALVRLHDGAHRRVGPAQRGHGRGRARRRRQRGQVVDAVQLEPEPLFHLAGLRVPAAGPQPHGRGRHEERRDETDGAHHGVHGGHRAPVEQRAQNRGRHQAQAHEQRVDQQEERPAVRRARLGDVHFRIPSKTSFLQSSKEEKNDVHSPVASPANILPM